MASSRTTASARRAIITTLAVKIATVAVWLHRRRDTERSWIFFELRAGQVSWQMHLAGRAPVLLPIARTTSALVGPSLSTTSCTVVAQCVARRVAVRCTIIRAKTGCGMRCVRPAVSAAAFSLASVHVGRAWGERATTRLARFVASYRERVVVAARIAVLFRMVLIMAVTVVTRSAACVVRRIVQRAVALAEPLVFFAVRCTRQRMVALAILFGRCNTVM